MDLDDSGDPSAVLSNAPRAPKTHWRQAAHLLGGDATAGRPSSPTLDSGQQLALGFRSITKGRELRFHIDTSRRGVESASHPLRTRPHAPKVTQPPPAEPPISSSPAANDTADAACASSGASQTRDGTSNFCVVSATGVSDARDPGC